MALIATPGAANANAYGTAAEGVEHFTTNRLYGGFYLAAETEDQERALIWAAAIFDAVLDYSGSKATVEQSLRVPRGGMAGPDGYYYTDTDIPAPFKAANFELADALLAKDRTKEPDLLGQGFSHVKAGVEVTVDAAQVLPLVPDHILDRLQLLGIGTPQMNQRGSATNIKLYRS